MNERKVEAQTQREDYYPDKAEHAQALFTQSEVGEYMKSLITNKSQTPPV